MSDLAATNCGGCNSCNGGMSSCLWIIILLLFCGNSGTGLFNNGGCGCDNGCSNNSCLWIILLLLFCGNGSFLNSNGCGCDCGCNNGCGC